MTVEKEIASLKQYPIHGVNFDPGTDMPIQVPCALFVKSEEIRVDEQTELWSLTDSGDRYTSTVKIYKQSEQYVLSVDCEGKGKFRFTDNSLAIDWNGSGTGPSHYLQTLGLSLFLELKGHLCLHANTLVKDNKGYLFLAPSRTGKSTLTTALTTKGFQLTTDDMACLYKQGLGYEVYPSWPKVRLWPDSKEFLQTSMAFNDSGIRKVHERFAKDEITLSSFPAPHPAKIQGLYFLRRDTHYEGKLEVKPMSDSKSIILLLQNSMLGDAYKALKIDKARFGKLTELVRNLPVFEVRYPSGLDKLDDVATQIEQKLTVSSQA